MNYFSGKGKDTEDISSETDSLANIMMSEMTKVTKKSTPITISNKKNQSNSIVQNK